MKSSGLPLLEHEEDETGKRKVVPSKQKRGKKR